MTAVRSRTAPVAAQVDVARRAVATILNAQATTAPIPTGEERIANVGNSKNARAIKVRAIICPRARVRVRISVGRYRVDRSHVIAEAHAQAR